MLLAIKCIVNHCREGTFVELRRLLFERDLTQIAVVREATEAGHQLDRTWLSRIVNGKFKGSPETRAAIRVGLQALGVTPEDVEAIPELREH